MRIASAAPASRCSSARPNSGCFAICSRIPAASFRASGCSTRFGRTIRDIDARTVDVHVRRLRKALNEAARPDIVRTVRSAGYSLDAEA